MHGTLTAILFHLLLLPTGLHAQPNEMTGETNLDRSLEICDKAEIGEEEGDYPCDRIHRGEYRG